MLKQITFHSEGELATHLGHHEKTFFISSMTSTVIPYDSLGEKLSKSRCIGDLSLLPTFMEIDNNGHLIVRGAVTWKDAKAFCQSKGFEILTSPTEELACVLAGVATSATGERCFGFDTLRDQVIMLKYFDHDGDEQTLTKNKLLVDHPFFELSKKKEKLIDYQRAYSIYQDYKNAPFPRLDAETDLMVGSEGQLGVISEVSLRLRKTSHQIYLLIALPKWEESFEKHLLLFEKVQRFRKGIFTCDFVDSNCLDGIDSEKLPIEGCDLIFLEIDEKFFQKVYDEFILPLDFIDEDKIFEIPRADYHALRVLIPRQISERNSRKGVLKRGTDAQGLGEKFKYLLERYKLFTKLGVDYNLFGHFGDGHLHFNFLPNKSDTEVCDQALGEFYEEIYKIKASPCAEHGIGLLKQKFVKSYYQKEQVELFSCLKETMDPHGQFFPEGFMGIKND